MVFETINKGENGQNDQETWITLIPTPRRQMQADLCEVKARLVSVLSSSSARATE